MKPNCDERNMQKSRCTEVHRLSTANELRQTLRADADSNWRIPFW